MSACNRLLLLEKHSRVYETPLALRTECTQQAWYAHLLRASRVGAYKQQYPLAKNLTDGLIARGIQADVVDEKARTAPFILEAHVGESIGCG